MNVAEATVSAYLDDLAARKPAPGGGSVAALVGALAAALDSMVANFTVGKPQFAAVEAEVRDLLAATEAARRELLALAQADMDEYLKVSAAYALPREGEEQQRARTRAIQQALKDACAVPMRTALACQDVLRLTRDLMDKGNPRLISDLGIAALLAESAFLCAWLNVEVNLAAISDEAYRTQVRRVLEPLMGKGRYLREEVWERVVKSIRR